MHRVKSNVDLNTTLLMIVITLLGYFGKKYIDRQDSDHDAIITNAGQLTNLDSRVTGQGIRIGALETIVPTLLRRTEYWNSRHMSSSNDMQHGATGLTKP